MHCTFFRDSLGFVSIHTESSSASGESLDSFLIGSVGLFVSEMVALLRRVRYLYGCEEIGGRGWL